MAQRGSGLEPALSRRAQPQPPPPPVQHYDPEDEYEAAEQGRAPPPPRQHAREEMYEQGTPPPRGQRRGPPPPQARRVDTAKPPGEEAPPSWLEKNRSLIVVSLGVLVILVILLIWYQFTRQPATPANAVRAPGQPRQQGAPPPQTKTGGDEEAPEPAGEPSEAVDETPEQETPAPKEPPTAKPKPPGAKKKAAAKPAPKRERVQGDTIRTADDKELNEFASMDVSAPGDNSGQQEEAEETEAS